MNRKTSSHGCQTQCWTLRRNGMKKTVICLFFFFAVLNFCYADIQLNEGWEGGGGTLSNLNHNFQFGYFGGTDEIKFSFLLDVSIGYGFYNDFSFDWRTGGLIETFFMFPQTDGYIGLGVGSGIGSGVKFYLRGIIYPYRWVDGSISFKTGLYYDHFFEYGWRTGGLLMICLNLW